MLFSSTICVDTKLGVELRALHLSPCPSLSFGLFEIV